MRCQDGTVSVESYCGDSKPSGCKRFSLLHTCLDWPRGPPTLFAIGSVGVLFPGRDVAECGIDHPPLSSAKVKNEWLYTSVAVMACYGLISTFT